MKDTLRDLFTFSASERKGVIVLITILLLVSGFNMLLVLHQPKTMQENPPEWMNDSTVSSGIITSDQFREDQVPDNLRMHAAVSKDKFLFDPNCATQEDLLSLGISPKISRVILNYRAKGGRFDTPEDLKKIYGMTQAQYDDIAPYIRISQTPSASGANTSSGLSETKRLLEINFADSAMFEKLPGIGPVLARRIVKYRTMLGGFYNIQQIKEVYGISDSLFHQIQYRIEADTSALLKLNLNTATEKELARHPYIGRYAASGIIRYRSEVSGIKNINELKVNGILSDAVFEKIRNYLSL
jgi:competence ComEA-like helix-hairpin-helix protein